MKKVLHTILLCGLSLMLFSCDAIVEKLNPDPVGNNTTTVSSKKGVFYTAASDAETLKLLPGKSKTVEAKVCVFESSVSDVTLNISLKIAPEGLDVYNASHKDAPAELLPSSDYEFVSNNLILARYNTSSTSAAIKITANDLEMDKLYVLPLTIDKVEGTDNWALAEQPYGFITVLQTVEGPEGGDGSMEFPYELRTVEDLLAMRSKLSASEKIYFKMMNDIDMSVMPQEEYEDPDTHEKTMVDVKWTPLNYASPYKFAIDFDGQGHTISNFYCDYKEYPSFFGVLVGYCHDVTFLNAKVQVESDVRTGILAGYCGLQNGTLRGEAARVHIQGELDHTKSTKYGAGGYFGFMGTGALYACSADVIVTSKLNNVGGLFGYCGKEVEVIDCWTSGVITGNQRVGGIGGGTVGDDDPNIPIKIVNCYSTAAVHGSFGIGGIGGYFTMAKATPKDVDPGNIFEKCIAWNDEIRANWNLSSMTAGTPSAGDKSHYSCGAIVGFAAVRNTYTDNYRNPAMKYNESIFFDYSDAFSLYDQANASASSPLTFNEVDGANYNYPYHGKAAAEGKTLSQVAQGLGWSAAVWDFSKDIPTLKPDAPVGPIPDVTSDGQLPGFGDNDL